MTAGAAAQVSVVIPVHNGADFLDQAIRSAVEQQDVRHEIIVADDASTDATPEIAASFGGAVRYVRLSKQPTGIAATNAGVELATSELICVLHHDDLLRPGKLARHVALMDANPSIGFSYSAQDFIDDAGQVLTTLRSPLAHHDYVRPGLEELSCLAVQNYLNFCNVVVRRNALEKVGLFPQQWQIIAEWITWARIAKTRQVGYVDDRLACYRIHAGQLTLKRRPDTYLEQLLVVHHEIFDDPSMPAELRRLRRLARNNIALNLAFLHVMRRERWAAGKSLASAARIWPWELPGFIRRATLGTRARLALTWRRSRD